MKLPRMTVLDQNDFIHFVEEKLPYINAPFVLITGDDVEAIHRKYSCLVVNFQKHKSCILNLF